MFFRPSGLHEGFLLLLLPLPPAWGRLISDMNYVITAEEQ